MKLIKSDSFHLISVQPLGGDWQPGLSCTVSKPNGCTLAFHGMMYNNPEYIYSLYYQKRLNRYWLYSGGCYQVLTIQYKAKL